MKRSPANDKPPVITGVGEYLTRDGRIVIIYTVNDHSDDYSVMRFNCKGYLYTPRVGKKDKLTWEIWHESGAYIGVGESPEDIINKIDK